MKQISSLFEWLGGETAQKPSRFDREGFFVLGACKTGTSTLSKRMVR